MGSEIEAIESHPPVAFYCENHRVGGSTIRFGPFATVEAAIAWQERVGVSMGIRGMIAPPEGGIPQSVWNLP
jgi:hypothetical protein